MINSTIRAPFASVFASFSMPNEASTDSLAEAKWLASLADGDPAALGSLYEMYGFSDTHFACSVTARKQKMPRQKPFYVSFGVQPNCELMAHFAHGCSESPGTYVSTDCGNTNSWSCRPTHNIRDQKSELRCALLCNRRLQSYPLSIGSQLSSVI